jgi:putative transposase
MLQAKPITLSDSERKILEDLAKGTHTPLHLIKRSQIILMAACGATNQEIERKLELSNHTVIKWRGKYFKTAADLAALSEKSPAKLKSALLHVLSDAQRPGTKRRVSDEQVAKILALYQKEPRLLGLPFAKWSCASLKKEAVARGIVDTISITQIRRYLKKREA